MAADRSNNAGSEAIVIGKLNGLFGTRGWLKVFSYTRPRERIADYRRWTIGSRASRQSYDVITCKSHGNTLIARLDGVPDRSVAAGLVGQDISVSRLEFEPLGEDEFYWADLIGAAVVTRAAEPLGTISRLFETGANDVMEVQGDRTRLIPFVLGHYVVDVDLGQRVVTVDWHPDD